MAQYKGELDLKFLLGLIVTANITPFPHHLLFSTLICMLKKCGRKSNKSTFSITGAASEGSRAMQLQKRREKEQKEAEFRKNKIKEELRVDKMENKFAVHYDAIEAQLKVSNFCE